MKLLGIGTNAKTVKSDKGGEYLTAIMYLAPQTQNSKKLNVCPKATDGCAKACLYTAGRGQQHQVQEARIRKTDWFLTDRKAFLLQLNKELHAFSKRCFKLGVKGCVRLNGTSDLNWGKWIEMSTVFPELQFYDYTKVLSYIVNNKHSNYHLTYSRNESHSLAQELLALKIANLAVVFSTPELPKEYLGYPVLNGDKDDLRFLDGDKGSVVGLYAKGAAKKDTSGFVVHLDTDTHLQLDMFELETRVASAATGDPIGLKANELFMSRDSLKAMTFSSRYGNKSNIDNIIDIL